MKFKALALTASILIGACFLKTRPENEISKSGTTVSDSKKLNHPAAQKEIRIPYEETIQNPAFAQESSKAPVPQKSVSALTADIRSLSLVVLKNSTQMLQMKTMLESIEVQQEIRSKLFDTGALSEARFSERTALIDVLYEGLKSDDQTIASKYLDLAEEVLATPPATEVKSNRALFTQFFGDRVEIALTVSKISKDQYKRLRTRTVSLNPDSDQIFKRASALERVYEVSL